MWVKKHLKSFNLYYFLFLFQVCLTSFILKTKIDARCLWLMPVILATQEAEIRRIMVWNQPGQKFSRPYLEKKTSQKRAGGIARGIGPEFKPQYHTHTHTHTQSWFWQVKLKGQDFHINHSSLLGMSYCSSIHCKHSLKLGYNLFWSNYNCFVL
jgi:hypothetical protein